MATQKAILAGINNYKSVSDLRGCISDVDKMERLLTESGFRAENIHRLTDDQVVKGKLLDELGWLFDRSAAGDQLVFFFAGHGSQVLDRNGDEEDGVDEILCLWDMDFDDPETYLLDDDINSFTGRLPEGVALTIVFDCCHSGTATRMLLAPNGADADAIAPNKTPLVELAVTTARTGDSGTTRSLSPAKILKRYLAPQSESERRQIVLARYIEPPRKVQSAMFQRGVRSGVGRRKDEESMNHIFFSASQATQTSADAFINGGYHGAFSYYFCREAKKDAGDVQKLIRSVRSALKRADFDQIPQLEPSHASASLFSEPLVRANSPSTPPIVTADGPVTDGPASHGSIPSQPSSAKVDQGIYTDIVQLLRQIVNRLDPQPELERAPGSRVVAGQRSLVYVHGICRHEPGYSDGWFKALSPHLSAELRDQLKSNRHEVLWSDLVSDVRSLTREAIPQARRSLVEAQERREREFTDMLRDIVEDRAQREAINHVPKQRDVTPQTNDVELSRGALERIGLGCLDDFAKYLLRNSVRRAVQQRFLEKVLPLLEGGAIVDVIGHSWGTVVAYESLRQLDGRDLPGAVKNLFTVGSALSIVTIKRRLEVTDFVKPRCVRRWINLDADGDFVGGGLRSLGYGVDHEFLNLEAVGCTRFFGNPACPHSSYFNPENKPVNRGIFAKFMES